MADWNPRANELFLRAVEVHDPAERAALLLRECGPDAALRRAVETLLAAHAAAGDFLADPHPAAVDATADLPPGGTRSFAPGDNTAYQPTEGVAGAVIAGRYKLLEQIGEGGMGTVWMADQTEPVKRRVAVKLVRADRGGSKAILARFEAERQAIALMDHPHIAKLLDAGATDRGEPFFVMELVKGVPLTQFCDQHRLTVPDRLALFGQICSAVQHAHQKGVIHRDLKPSNILVESHDGKPVPKVIDFGLAKAAGPKLTDHTLFTGFGAVLGTPQYMAPEQAAFNAVDVDTRADVYALGVILYELLTGTTPIARETLKKAALDEVLRVIREQVPAAPSSRISTSEARPAVAAARRTEPAKLGRFVKGELDWIVMKALAKDRDRRYETASGFAKDVERFLNREPVQAGPPTAGYRVRKFVARNKGPVAAAGLVVLALAVGVAGTTWGMIRADNARAAEADRAEGERAAKEQAQRALEAEAVARELARRRLAQVETGVDLLGSVFDEINPGIGGLDGPSLRAALAARLSRAAADLDAGAVGDPLAVARVRSALARALASLGRPEAAVELAAKVWETRSAALGPDHPDTLAGLAELANAVRFAGNLDRAADLHREALAGRAARLGPDHPDTLVSQGNLGEVYLVGRRPDRAVPVLTEALARRRAVLDPDHLDILVNLGNLSAAYLAAGLPGRAVPPAEEALARLKAKYGTDHPLASIAAGNLAAAYLAAGRAADAVPPAEEALARVTARFGPDHRLTWQDTGNLAKAYLAAGRAADAVPLLARVVAWKRARPGGDPALADLLVHVAGDLLTAGQFAAAEPHLRELLAIREAAQPDVWSTFNTRSQLGGSLLGQGKSAEAEPLLLAGYRGMKQRQAAIPPNGRDRLPEAADRLVELYRALGKPDEVKRWRAERAEYPPPAAPPPRPAVK